jgi:hypothetical protein
MAMWEANQLQNRLIRISPKCVLFRSDFWVESTIDSRLLVKTAVRYLFRSDNVILGHLETEKHIDALFFSVNKN